MWLLSSIRDLTFVSTCIEIISTSRKAQKNFGNLFFRFRAQTTKEKRTIRKLIKSDIKKLRLLMPSMPFVFGDGKKPIVGKVTRNRLLSHLLTRISCHFGH
jgi:hypothetical protein